MHGAGEGGMGALRRILGLFGFCFCCFAKSWIPAGLRNKSQGSGACRLGSCPLLLPVFSYLPKAGLAGWAPGLFSLLVPAPLASPCDPLNPPGVV